MPKIEVVSNESVPAPPAQQYTIVAYEIPFREYHSYIRSCYRARPAVNNLQAVKAIVTPVSILDPLWRTSFGNPYTPDSYSKSKYFEFGEDFNCLNPEFLQTGSGIIKNVSKKTIEIEDELGYRSTLNLGSVLEAGVHLAAAKSRAKKYTSGAGK